MGGEEIDGPSYFLCLLCFTSHTLTQARQKQKISPIEYRPVCPHSVSVFVPDRLMVFFSTQFLLSRDERPRLSGSQSVSRSRFRGGRIQRPGPEMRNSRFVWMNQQSNGAREIRRAIWCIYNSFRQKTAVRVVSWVRGDMKEGILKWWATQSGLASIAPPRQSRRDFGGTSTSAAPEEMGARPGWCEMEPESLSWTGLLK